MKDIWMELYELTADPWTETEDEKIESEKMFYEDMENGDIKVYVDCLKENRAIYEDEDDVAMVKRYDDLIKKIDKYGRS